MKKMRRKKMKKMMTLKRKKTEEDAMKITLANGKMLR